MNSLLFVYGTLKRGGCNHHHIAAQTLVGPAFTVPGFCLYDLGGYPGIAARPEAPSAVVGEVWSVTPEALTHLDDFEGVATGLYRRGWIPLQAPYADQSVEAYFPVRDPSDLRPIGAEWKE